MNATGTRKAAVLLASLAASDRRWLMRRLPSAWRSVLKLLIDDAGRLGSHDSELVRGALGLDATEPASAVAPLPEVLLAGMAGLSPAWAARVLAACAPDHLGLYATHCDPAQAEATRQEFARVRGTLPPKLADALGRAVRARGTDAPAALSVG